MSDASTPVEERAAAGAPVQPHTARRVAPLVAAVALLLFAGLLWMLVAADPPRDDESADSPLIGRPAPAVVSTTLDRKAFDLSRRRGSWVVLNFFNSTCVPCIREHPELVTFDQQQGRLGATGAELYTIVFDDDDTAVTEFFADNGGDWPIVLDPDGTIAVSFGMSQVPETWIVDPAGTVSARFIGQITAAQLTATLRDLGAQQGA